MGLHRLGGSGCPLRGRLRSRHRHRPSRRESQRTLAGGRRGLHLRAGLPVLWRVPRAAGGRTGQSADHAGAPAQRRCEFPSHQPMGAIRPSFCRHRGSRAAVGAGLGRAVRVSPWLPLAGHRRGAGRGSPGLHHPRRVDAPQRPVAARDRTGRGWDHHRHGHGSGGPVHRGGGIGRLGLGGGVVVMAPTIEMPRVTGFIAGGGPIIPGPIFPFVFITIACGAISGFHSLVSSGTTPKMVDRESHALVGYGAMLMESFVGVIALIAASLLLPGDYFAINTTLSADALGALGYPVAHIQELSRLVEQQVMGRPGGAVSLAVGMASIFSALPGMTGLMAYWYQFALLFEALFILTTIDAGM